MFSLFSAVFLGMAAFALLLPSILFALQNMGVSTGFSTVSLGLYSACSFVLGPVLGRISDKYGRKRVLLWTLLGASVAYGLMWSSSDEPVMVYTALALAGAMAGNMAVIFAAVADRTSKEGRARGMGMIGAAIGLAFTVGPFAGGFLGGRTASEADLMYPAMASSILCFLGYVVIFAAFQENKNVSRGSVSPGDLGDPDIHSSSGVALLGKIFSPEMRRHKSIFILLAVMLIFTLALSLMEPSLPLLMRQKYFSGPREVGTLFLVVGLTLVVVQGGLIAPLTRRFGETVLASSGMVFMALGLAVIAFSGQILFVFIGAWMTATGSALHNTSLASLLSFKSDVSEVGRVMGLFHAMQSLGRTIGPLFAGLLFYLETYLPFLVGILLVAFCFILFVFEKTVPVKDKAAE